ncbi:MAG: glutathione peroxidase [Vicinamibacterales bacterium]
MASAALYDIPVTTLDGHPAALGDYRGKVLLIVNVASACGFTPQYAGLEALYRAHRDQGFEILAFPCNQFGSQEPGDADAIRSFCSTTYDVSFPIFAKTDVNGPGAHPLYRFLKAERPGALGTEAIKWNFTKFLVGRDGSVLHRYAPMTPPEKIERDIIDALRR